MEKRKFIIKLKGENHIMAKKIAINAGSSSLKFTLFEMPEEEEVASGIIERIGLKDSIFTTKFNGEKYKEVNDIENHKIAIQKVLDKLIELGAIADYTAARRPYGLLEELTTTALYAEQLLRSLSIIVELSTPPRG